MQLRWLLVFFGILSVIFGIWGFALGQPTAWASAQVMFWMCFGVFLVLLTVALIGWSGYGRRRPSP